jgi:hypothetical protein
MHTTGQRNPIGCLSLSCVELGDLARGNVSTSQRGLPTFRDLSIVRLLAHDISCVAIPVRNLAIAARLRDQQKDLGQKIVYKAKQLLPATRTRSRVCISERSEAR